MNELDVVRVKETVMATPIIDDLPIEIIAGRAGTIVACADTYARMVEFIEFRDEPVIVEATNLEVVRAIRP